MSPVTATVGTAPELAHNPRLSDRPTDTKILRIADCDVCWLAVLPARPPPLEWNVSAVRTISIDDFEKTTRLARDI
jgi:hypothetical protein